MTEQLTAHIAWVDVDDGILDRQVENCPTCKSKLETGFGLAGGGMGVYGFCEKCVRVVWKCVTEGEE